MYEFETLINGTPAIIRHSKPIYTSETLYEPASWDFEIIICNALGVQSDVLTETADIETIEQEIIRRFRK